MALDSDCAWQGHNCGFDNTCKGEFAPVEGHPGWFTGRIMKDGTLLYVGTASKDPWWEKGPPQGLDGRPGPFFTTSLARAEAFGGTTLAYRLQWDLVVLFTGRQGGWETQEEVFAARYDAYYSCKECEVSMKNDIVGDYVDWEHVVVVNG